MSSIDTESIITQLMAVERRPQQLLQSNVTTLQRSQAAWQSIAAKLTALSTAADSLASMSRASTFVTATSTDPTAVTVRATGTGTGSTLSVEVLQLAAAHSVVGGDTFTGAADGDGGRTLELTIGGTTHTLTSADGTIGGLAAAVDAAGLGVRATLLQTSPGAYQLVLTSSSTGADAAFTAAGTGWSGFTTARQGADAVVAIDGVQVTRPSNVIGDAVDGMELTLARVTTAPVEVGVGRDDEGIVAAVKALVDAANAALSTITTTTKSSTDEASRGALAGDSTARRLADSIRSIVATPLTGSGTSAVTSSSLGVSLTREGTLTFDETKLRSALATDPDAALAALGRSGSSSAAGVSVAGSTASATPGTRTVSVTQAATQATLAGLPVPPPAPGTTVSMNIVTPQGTYLVSFEAGATWSVTAGNLNAALRAAGAHLTASTDGSSLQLTADRWGSAGSFTVSGGDDVGLGGTATGVDAQGTIDGTPFTATGRSVSSGGIVYTIDATAAQVAAAGGALDVDVTFRDGLAGALARIGNEGSASGVATSAQTALADRIADLNARIAAYDDRLALREQTLRQRFTAMETLLAQLQSTSSSLGLLSTQES